MIEIYRLKQGVATYEWADDNGVAIQPPKLGYVLGFSPPNYPVPAYCYNAPLFDDIVADAIADEWSATTFRLNWRLLWKWFN